MSLPPERQQGGENTSASLENKSLLELSELYRSSEWKLPKSYSHRKIFWATFTQRLFSCRDEVALKNSDGFYPLHLITRDPVNSSTMHTPYFILHSLVSLYPPAAVIPDLNGTYPYTYIFDKWVDVDDDTIKKVIDADSRSGYIIYRTVLRPDILHYIAARHPTSLNIAYQDDCIPLHSAAKLVWFHKNIFDLILEQGQKFQVGGKRGMGGLFIKDKDKKTPLDNVLYASFASKFRNGKQKSLSVPKPDQLPVDWEWVWELIMACCRARTENVRAPPLHSAIEVGCPHSIIRLIMDKRPEDIRVRDSRGMSPLAVAAFKDVITSDTIDALLHNHPFAYPEAALITDNAGNLPLHLALESTRKVEQMRWDTCQAIIESAPDALQIPNKRRMYPFMIAAVNEMNSLNMVYVLLRNAPFVIHA